MPRPSAEVVGTRGGKGHGVGSGLTPGVYCGLGLAQSSNVGATRLVGSPSRPFRRLTRLPVKHVKCSFCYITPVTS